MDFKQKFSILSLNLKQSPMKNIKSNSEAANNQKEVGGYRASADEYKHIINDYILRVSVVKDANLKRKSNY